MMQKKLHLYDALKKPGHRRDRVAKQLQESLAVTIQQKNIPPLTHPDGTYRFVNSQISITRVVMSPDLRRAIVYLRLLLLQEDSEANKKNTMRTIIEDYNQLSFYFKKIVADQLRLRFTPEILFKEDEDFDKMQQLESLIDEVNTSAATTEQEQGDDH